MKGKLTIIASVLLCAGLVSAQSSGSLFHQPQESDFKLGEVYAFPNPAKSTSKTTLHIEAGVADEVEIRIYDASGGIVHQTRLLENPRRIQGLYAYEYAWSLSGVGSGIYFFVVAAKKAGRPDLISTGKCAVIK
ncbi:MAG: T9SS type A sorting domain-containing protein [Elusimicrobia bacterium]|nr:T9SS type A sorting domain-containing protein [Elusimicrobiota bacterium]